MTVFVGDKQHEFVDSLVERLDRLRAGEDVPRVVVLEAESGAGKSRILREFYGRLRERQPVNDSGDGYWPTLSEDATGPTSGLEPMPQRKVIGPRPEGFLRPPETFPTFAWFSLNCADASDGSFINVVQLMWPTLRAHLRFLAAGWRKSTTKKEQFRHWWETHGASSGSDLGTEVSTHILEEGLKAFGATVPFLGYGLDRASSGARWVGEAFRIRRDLRAGGGLDAAEDFSPATLALLLKSVVGPDMPMIIAIEDMHLMDPTLASFIDALTAFDNNKPVMVVGTAWPEGRALRTYAEWRRGVQNAPGGVEIVGVDRFPFLDKRSLADIAMQFAEKSAPGTLAMVADKWPNPHALCLALTDRFFARDFIQDGRLQVDTADLADMPSEVRSLYRRRWMQLPHDVQDSLMLAAGSLGEDSTEVASYFPDIVAAAAVEGGLAGNGELLADSFLAAVDPYDWTRIADEEEFIHQFREASLQSVARDEFDGRQGRRGPDLRDSVIEALERRILSGVDTPIPEPGLLVMCRWLLDLQAPLNDASATAALFLASSAADAMQPTRALELITTERLAVLEKEPLRGSYVRQAMAMWCLRDRRIADAITHIDAAVSFEQVLGRDNERDMLTRMKAVPLAELGFLPEAIALHEEAIKRLQSDPNDRSAEIRFHRRHLASALSLAGQAERGLAIIGSLAASVSPPPAGETYTMDDLDILNANAVALTRDRQYDVAAGVLSDLIQKSPVPPESQIGLTLKANYSDALIGLGDPNGLELLQEVVREREERLGSTHPQTLMSRATLAKRLLDSGDATALTLLRDTFNEQVAAGIRGVDLEATGIAVLKALGDSAPEDQIEIARHLVRARHPGLDPDTLEDRAKQTAMAFPAILDSLASEEMALQSAALTARAAGDPLTAATQFDELRRMLEKKGHPPEDVLGTRLNGLIAFTAGIKSGVTSPQQLEERVSRGLSEANELVPLLAELFGDEHQFTLSARNSRVRLQRSRGHQRAARDELLLLVPVMQGSNHPEAENANDHLKGIDAAWTLYEGQELKRIKQLASRDPEAALDRLQRATEILREAGIVSSIDKPIIDRRLIITKGMRSDPRSASIAIRHICDDLQVWVDEDFSLVGGRSFPAGGNR